MNEKKYINSSRLKTLIQEKYLPSDSLTAGILSDLLSMAEREEVAVVIHGKWTQTQGGVFPDEQYAECSNCKEEYFVGDLSFDEFIKFHNFCPNCGTRMDGDSDV